MGVLHVEKVRERASRGCERVSRHLARQRNVVVDVGARVDLVEDFHQFQDRIDDLVLLLLKNRKFSLCVDLRRASVREATAGHGHHAIQLEEIDTECIRNLRRIEDTHVALEELSVARVGESDFVVPSEVTVVGSAREQVREVLSSTR